jgi:hypothetical protein
MTPIARLAITAAARSSIEITRYFATTSQHSLLQPNGTVVFIVLLLKGSAMPDSRHKLRNAGRVFATNRETRIFAAKYA